MLFRLRALCCQPRYRLWSWIALVFAGLAFILPGVAKYHSDEAFYTDAALRMLHTGDYLTPYAVDGHLRFAKPILPYWGVVAGFRLCGVNFFGARLFFLVAGCGVIYLTYKLSLVLFKSSAEALLAALIMASNVQLLTISIRSTPDALLCVFVLMSLLGFARLIFEAQCTWPNYALAYVGAALAVETRGLPGLGVALYGLLFCIVFRRGKTPLHRLIHWPVLLLAFAVGASWFVAMLWLHGHKLVEGFYIDQVTENVTGYRPLDTLKNLQVYIVGVLRHFLPWSALALAAWLGDRSLARQFWRERRSESVFLLGWFLFILLAFVFGSFYRTRYMIVAYPSLAVWLAGLLTRYADSASVARWLPGLTATAAWFCAIAGIVLALAGEVIAPRLALGGVLLAVTGMTVAILGGRREPSCCWPGIAYLTIIVFCGTEIFLRPFFSRSPAAAATAVLLRHRAAGTTVRTYNVSPSYEAQIRVISGGQLQVEHLGSALGTDTLTGPVLFGWPDKELFAAKPGILVEAGMGSRKWPARDILGLLKRGAEASVLARNLVPYYVLFPESASR